MTEDMKIELAVLKNELDNLHESMENLTVMVRSISEKMPDISTRIKAIEIRQEQCDKYELEKRTSALEKWRAGIIAGCTIIVMTGHYIVTGVVKNIVQESLDTHMEQTHDIIETTINRKLDEKLQDYVFDIINT